MQHVAHRHSDVISHLNALIAETERALRAQVVLAEGLNRKLMDVEGKLAEREADVAHLKENMERGHQYRDKLVRQFEAALAIIAEERGGGREGALEIVKDEVERANAD